VLLNEPDVVIYRKRLSNDLPTILERIDLQLVLVRRWLECQPCRKKLPTVHDYDQLLIRFRLKLRV